MSSSATAATASTSPIADHGGRLRHLDGLRGFAVVAVILFHCDVLAGGFWGVDLFFALSGFVITAGLLREADRSRTVHLGRFLARRARRLLPAFFALIIGTLVAVTAIAGPNVRQFALLDTPWALAQVSNWYYIAEHIDYGDGSRLRVFAHLWSIAVEWQFYLVWPIVVAVLARSRERHRLVLIVAGAAALLSVALLLNAGVFAPTRAYEGTDTRAFALLFGAIAATRPAQQAAAALSRKAAGTVVGAIVVVLGGLWVLTPGTQVAWVYQGGLPVHSLLAALLVLLLAAHPGLLAARVAASAIPCRVGEYSYGMYLWHWPIVVLLPAWPGADGHLLRTAVVLTSAGVLGWASTRWIETPIRRGPRWVRGWRGATALAIASIVTVALWALLPRPDVGAGTVDLDRL